MYIIDVDTGKAYRSKDPKKDKKAIASAGLEKALLMVKSAKKVKKLLTLKEVTECYLEHDHENNTVTFDNITVASNELWDLLEDEAIETFTSAVLKPTKEAPPKAAPTKKTPPKEAAPGRPLAAGRQRKPRPIGDIPIEGIYASTFKPGTGAHSTRGLIRKFNEELEEWGTMTYDEVVDFTDGDEEAALKLLRTAFSKDQVEIA